MTCKVNKTCIVAPWWQISMPHLLHFLLDLCMHHCKLGCILHLSCAEATHGGCKSQCLQANAADR